MFSEVNTLEEYASLIENEPAVLCYFSTESCNVCKVLKPKVAELLAGNFPKIKMVYIQTDKQPEIAAQNRIFAVPTLLVYFEGREYIRKSRNIGIQELYAEIDRPYSMIFSE